MLDRAIFYDLETTDKNPIGQILNYCFYEVDRGFNVLNRCTGLIRISPLEIPSPSAVLANRTDVLEHQRQVHARECDAMREASDFIVDCIERS